MIDTLNINKNSQLGGMVTVQLRKDDKIIEEVKAHNFITPVVGEIQNFLQRRFIGYDLKNGYTFNANITSPFTFFYDTSNDPMIFLLNSDVYPDPTYPANRWQVGNIIGYATKDLYSGSDTQRGTINAAESVPTENGIKLVFDWPTNAANGTIKSIQFFMNAPSYISSQTIRNLAFSSIYFYNGRFYTYCSDTQQFGYITRTGLWVPLIEKPAAITGVTSCCYDGTYWYIVYGSTSVNNLFKMDNSGNIIYSVKQSVAPDNIAINSISNILVMSSGTTVYKLDPATGAYTGLSLAGAISYSGIAPWLDGFLVFPTTSSGAIQGIWYIPSDLKNFYIRAQIKSFTFGMKLTIDDGNMIVAYFNNGSYGKYFYYYPFGNVISRVILPQAITKTSANTLKVIYEFNYY